MPGTACTALKYKGRRYILLTT